MHNKNSQEKNLTVFIDNALLKHRNKPAYQFLRNDVWHHYSFADVENSANTMVLMIKKMQLKPRDQIGILIENSPEWIMAFIAILKSNCIPVSLDASLAIQDIANQINTVDLKAILCSKAKFAKLQQCSLQSPVHTLIVDDPVNDYSLTLEPKISKKEILEDLSDVAIIGFTSGTSSGFKAVKLTHTNLIYAAEQGAKFANDSFSILPMNHIYGVVSAIIAIFTGIHSSFAAELSPGSISRLLNETHPVCGACVPRLLEMFNKSIIDQINQKNKFIRTIILNLINICYFFKYHFKLNLGRFIFKKIHRAFGARLQNFYSGGSSLDGNILKNLEGVGFNIVEGYGLTETTGMCLVNDINASIPYSIGRALSQTQIHLAFPDAEGVGELCISGPSVMKGYYNNAETEDTFTVNGWFRTGDLATIDKNGNVFIQGRLKELIVTSGGKKASPSNIENYYKNVHGIKEFAVLGVPIKTGGTDQIFAVIEVDKNLLDNNENITILEEKIKREIFALSPEVPDHLRIESVFFVNAIKKTSTLKVKRKEIAHDIMKSLAEASVQKNNPVNDTKDSPNSALNGIEKIIQETIATALQVDTNTVKIHKNLSEYGIDSLMAMHILNKLKQQFGTAIQPEKLFSNPTIANLAIQIKQCQENPIAERPVAPIPINNRPKQEAPVKSSHKATFKTKNIFLTGGTGVLGGQLIKQMLPLDVKIFCLVRAKNTDEAFTRITAILNAYETPEHSMRFLANKIVPVLGDVAEAQFGLADADYQSLQSKIDLTLHCAAKVNLHGVYDAIKGANLNGTRHAIDFTLKTEQKYLVYVSTYTVMGDIQFTNATPFQENELDRGQGFTNLGYQRTKFESELLVRAAGAQGLKWMITRPGDIFGEADTGNYPLKMTNVTGIFYDIFKTVLETKIGMISPFYFDITPVDYVAKGILYFALQRLDLYQTYHLLNPDAKRYYDIILLFKSCGYNVDLVSATHYCDLLLQGKIKKHGKEYISATTELLKLNPAVIVNHESTHASSHYTQALLKEANIICPPIDQKLIQTYLSYCQRVGFINLT